MNRFKWQAYCQEFPFLKTIRCLEDMDLGRLSNVAVRRLDRDVLSRIPNSSFHDGSMGKSESFESVCFVLADGLLHNCAVKQHSEWSSNYAHSGRRENPGETVLEAADRLENPDQLTHMVWVAYQYDNWESGTYHCSWRIEIFKPPKGEKISDILADAHESAAREVAIESDF
jgi:hypothetical protein